jgi:predicted transposase YbfD/YdcC
VDHWVVRVVPVEPDALNFPWARQIVAVTKTSVQKKTGKTSVDTRYFVTSLDSKEAKPKRLFGIIRGHWSVENKNHWRRDAIWGEDHCLLRSPNAACALALIRNALLALIIPAGFQNLAAALESMHANPSQAISLISENQ